MKGTNKTGKRENYRSIIINKEAYETICGSGCQGIES